LLDNSNCCRDKRRNCCWNRFSYKSRLLYFFPRYKQNFSN